MGKKGRRRKITRYWHGGAPGLNVGDDLVPATALDHLPVLYADPDYGSDPAYVYVSTSQTLAMGCAAQWGSHFGDRVAGDLYQVEPKGALEVDPDYAHVPDLSWRCQRAAIVAVYRRSVEMTHELSIYGLQFTTWDDGQPMYDQAGFLLPNLGMRQAGITASDLSTLGTGAPWFAANELAQRLASQRGGLDSTTLASSPD